LHPGGAALNVASTARSFGWTASDATEMGFGMNLKRSIAAAALTAALAACATGAATDAASDRNSPAVRATAAPGAREYNKTTDAILAADLDSVVARARASGATGPSNAAVASIVVMDELAAGRPSSARAMLDTLPERYRGGASDLLEAWVVLAEGDAAKAADRAREAAPRLPGRLGSVLVALIEESSGNLAARRADLRPHRNHTRRNTAGR
jgi:hypothetical protein